jgi:hypothetical protein
MASSLVQDERIQTLNDVEQRDGEYVLYWMQYSQRADHNHALEYAVAIQEWIATELRPGPLAGPHASYGLKHIYERLTGHYLTNGEMKGAMLVSSSKPVDRCELAWRFRSVPADPKIRARSIEASIARWRVA